MSFDLFEECISFTPLNLHPILPTPVFHFIMDANVIMKSKMKWRIVRSKFEFPKEKLVKPV